MQESSRLCAICGKRKPKRFCPGVSGDICTLCCGTEREVTVLCPLTCVYLIESRGHAVRREVDPKTLPNMDIVVDEPFLRRNESLMTMIAMTMLKASLFEGVQLLDTDIRDALAALTQTYKTLQSGLVYEVRPENPLAGKVVVAVQETVATIREYLAGEQVRLDDRNVLKVLVFFQRIELTHWNGRPKSRGFIHFLGGFVPPQAVAEPSDTTLVSGDAPSGLIITP
ncbi:MAG: hypothetical protein SGI92_28055 [Bryobacteraceae bacterium]|nr:hypothetical protein [Bryobacteraceae bacterium]